LNQVPLLQRQLALESANNLSQASARIPTGIARTGTIQNIIDNAIKYSPGKTVSIKVRELFDNHAALIKIEDTGIGISSPDKENLFTKFFRAENARKVQPDGNGLGLFIAKNIITKGRMLIGPIFL